MSVYSMFKKSNRLPRFTVSVSLIALSTATLLANPFEITLNEEFQGKISPDKMHASINVGMKQNDQKEIKRFFDSLLKKVKSKQDACTGGSYSISPEYNYKSQPYQLIGYRGNIYFQCTFDDTEAFDTSLNVIQKNIDLSLHTLTQSGIQWISSEERLQTVKDKLKKEAIQYGMDYSGELTRISGKTCHVSKINLSNRFNSIRPMREMDLMSAKAQSTEAPIKDEQSVTLSADYTFICK